MNKIHILLLLSFVSIYAQAQYSKQLDPELLQKACGKATRSELMTAEYKGFIQPDMNAPDWNFQFIRMDDEGVKDPELIQIKNSYPDKRKSNSYRTEESDPLNYASRATITKGVQFDANLFDGSYPPDNSIAVSKDGNIVTAVNSNIRYYNTGGQLKGSRSFSNFVNDNTLNSVLYDPKVLYDSGSDRFFLCMLHGFSPSNSHILLFFSKTTNPNDGWYYYKIKMSNHASNRWADYPNIGVSNNEVYVTVNLFDNTDFFKESVLFQINKNIGYNGGANLNYLYWNNIKDDQNQGSFTLMPCSYGLTGNYGPGIVLCGVRSAGSGNRIQIFDLTQDIGNNPQLNGYSVSVPNFQIGSNAVQPGNSQDLDVGDCRMKHGFFLNNMIHCTFTAVFQNGYNGIYYARIGLNPLSATTKKYGQANVDIAYPVMAPFTNSSTDKTVIFMFERSSSSIFPSMQAIVCDDNMNFGTPIDIKSGSAFIDVESNQNDDERWGDYSGMARHPATVTPSVWVFGIYGKSGNVYGNNVCEISNGVHTSIEDLNIRIPEVTVYPNPTPRQFTLKIKPLSTEQVSIDITDASGRVIEHLADKELVSGIEYQISFNRNLLPSGIYFLRISNLSKVIAYEKIIIH